MRKKSSSKCVLAVYLGQADTPKLFKVGVSAGCQATWTLKYETDNFLPMQFSGTHSLLSPFKKFTSVK